MWQLIGGSLVTGGSHGTTGTVVNPALATPMCVWGGGLALSAPRTPTPPSAVPFGSALVVVKWIQRPVMGSAPREWWGMERDPA